MSRGTNATVSALIVAALAIGPLRSMPMDGWAAKFQPRHRREAPAKRERAPARPHRAPAAKSAAPRKEPVLQHTRTTLNPFAVKPGSHCASGEPEWVRRQEAEKMAKLPHAEPANFDPVASARKMARYRWFMGQEPTDDDRMYLEEQQRVVEGLRNGLQAVNDMTGAHVEARQMREKYNRAVEELHARQILAGAGAEGGEREERVDEEVLP